MVEFEDLEKARIELGARIVVTSIAAVNACLIVILLSDALKETSTTITDKVALLGAVTTFLGAVVGVFFGVNASDSNGSRNSVASAENSQAAAKHRPLKFVIGFARTYS